LVFVASTSRGEGKGKREGGVPISIIPLGVPALMGKKKGKEGERKG